MNSQNIKFSIVVVIAIILVLGIIYVRVNSLEYEKNFAFEATTNIAKDEIFHLMSDVEIYPIVLSENYESVKILEDRNNVLISEETVQERGIKTTLLVKHTLTSTDLHQIEILDGYAEGSIITVKFVDIGSNYTKISVDMSLKLTGFLGVFSDMTNTNYQSAFNNILESFERYYLLIN